MQSTTHHWTPERAAELRATIPGWGSDLDPADRPQVPRERPSTTRDAYGDVPIEAQPERRPRERSIEHAKLTPVFGATVPLKGLSGAVRRYAYRRHSEAKAAHWLLLLAGDRIDVAESVAASWARGKPELPFLATGLRTERSHHGMRSRVGRGRTDVGHQALDPLVVMAPWVVLAGASGVAVRGVVRRVRRDRG